MCGDYSNKAIYIIYFNPRTMKSLYAKFVLVGMLFTCMTVGVQFLWWRQRYLFVYETGTVDGTDGRFVKTNSVNTSLVKNKLCGDSLGECGASMATSNSINRSPVRIWDTSSGHDRIPEQMRHVPLNANGHQRPRVIIIDDGPRRWNLKYGRATFEENNCSVSNCHLQDSSTEEQRVDAILFGIGMYNVRAKYESKRRHNDVVWIFYALESPMATNNFPDVNNLFNWTATYRRDSTMVAPYERWLSFANATTITRTRNYAKTKTKMAAIFVSNCVTNNKRLEYAKELGKHVGVDIYGLCGDMRCPRTEHKICFELLNKHYKFYLAFENANCRDYITEKFFVNGLGHDVIPIVMGAHPEDYAEAAPPHSYIHVEDFKSPKELAEYMNKLDKNDDLYNEYFNWKGTGTFLDTKFWCRLCALVSDDNKPRLVIKDINDWWKSKDTCRNGRWA